MAAKHRVLVVYYSRTGNTARVATQIASRLDADLEEIRELADRRGALGYLRAGYDSMRELASEIAAPQKNPADYAVLIVGSPVWGWKMTPAVRAYLRRVKNQIGSVAFFVTSGDTDVAKIAPSMEAVAGLKAIASAGFNAKELADAARFERKAEQFAAAIRAGLV
jgi:hypothetical protein